MKFLRKSVASGTIFLYLYSSLFPAWADAVSSSASAGNQVAVDAMNNFSAPTLVDGQILFGNGTQSVKVSDLFNTSGGGESKQSIEDVFGNDEKTLELGGASNARLKVEQSAEGDAYRTLLGTGQMVRPNIANDPLWLNTDKTIANQANFEKDFADCKKIDTVTPSKLTKRVPDYKTCERVLDSSGKDTLYHSYAASLLEYKSGPANIQSCGRGCIDVWLGQVGDNYWSGHCSIYEHTLSFFVHNPDAISSAIINYAKYDDYMQVWLGPTKVWSGPNGNFPPETPGPCELATSWQQSLNVNVTDEIKKGGLIPFKIRASVAGRGEAYASLRITYDPKKILTEDRWHDAAALEKAQSITDGFCPESTYSCAKMPPVTDGCASVNGMLVCENDFKDPPLPDISPLCQEVSIDAQCGFYKGQMSCYTDAQGNEQCPINSDKVCSVTHSIKAIEIPLTVSFAGPGTLSSEGVKRVTVDFKNGQTSPAVLGAGSRFAVAKKSYDDVCLNPETKKVIPGKTLFTGTSLWDGGVPPGSATSAPNVSVIQAPTCENGLVAVVDVFADGNAVSSPLFSGSSSFKIVQVGKESWGPDFCIKAANKINSGQCSESGSVVVTKGPSGQCLPFAGTSICPGDVLYNSLLPSPIIGVDKLSTGLRVEGCVEGAMNLDSCAKYESDKTCGFISQKCVDGASGPSGQCYVKEEVWDCGYEVEVPSATLDSKYQCDGPVRCLGTECFNPVDEKSSDFGYAAAALQVAQFAAHDMVCGEGNDPQTRGDCKIWKGEMFECKKAVGGWVDCCEAPDGVSIYDYMNLTWNTMKAANHLGAFGSVAQKDGLFTYGKDLAIQGWNTVVESVWSSSAETLMADTVGEGIIAQFQQELMNQVAQWTYEVFGEAAAQTLFATAGTNGATGYVPGADAALSNTVGTLLSGIMIAYMVYQIVNILVQIIWECEEREFELGSKKATKLCHFVGSYCASDSALGCIEKRESYCCFNSPMARIIHQQARPQLGKDWGDAENPDCSGLSIEDLGKLDWDQIDLSEWIGIMNLTGHYPVVEGMNLDRLTGKDSTLSIGGTRSNTLDRNLERSKDMNFLDTRKTFEDEIRTGLK
jgi:hypothetical protein